LDTWDVTVTHVEPAPRAARSAHADERALTIAAILEKDREAVLDTVFDTVVVDEAFLLEDLGELRLELRRRKNGVCSC
jgi:hypothetical protein